MKVKNITNPKEFFKTLQDCEGSIELVTAEGDRLNLKSKLCQYIVLTDLFSKAEIGEMEIFVSQPEDLGKIIGYLIRG